MREIKFRAWNKNKSCMIYLDETYPKSKYKLEFEIFNGFNLTLMEMTNRENVYYKDGEGTYIEHFEPVESVIMQYIGLKDSNKNKLYEGDKVKIEDYFGDDIIGRVIYDETTAGYVFHKGNERNYFQMTLDLESYVYYVIGNIYENTELLEEVMETH